jgi:hypothetical protein
LCRARSASAWPRRSAGGRRRNPNPPTPALRIVRSVVHRATSKHHARSRPGTFKPHRERRVPGLRLRWSRAAAWCWPRPSRSAAADAPPRAIARRGVPGLTCRCSDAAYSRKGFVPCPMAVSCSGRCCCCSRRSS